MYFLALLLFSLVWGQLSTLFFFRGWISFLGLLYGIIALARRRGRSGAIGGIMFARFSESAFFMLLLGSGFYVFYHRLQLGRTTAESLVYLISASVRLFFVLPRIATMIDQNIREVDEVSAGKH